MFHSKQGRMLMGLLILVLAVAAVAVTIVAINPVAAQVPPQGQPPGNQGMPPMMGGGMGGGMSGGMGGMQPMMPGGMGGMTAITASGDYVYVVRGNMLYQFSAKTLKPVNKIPIEEIKPPVTGQPAPQPSY